MTAHAYLIIYLIDMIHAVECQEKWLSKKIIMSSYV